MTEQMTDPANRPLRTRVARVNIVFVEPAFPRNQRRFVAALAAVGATVIGVGETPEDHLDEELRSWMAGYYRVANVTDVSQLDAAVGWASDRLWVDRLESTIESHQMAAAQVREAHGIPGTSVRTTWLCRDKPSMKQVLREAGVATAASTAADTPDEVRDFARQEGYPLILKPRAGAGAQGTVRVDDDTALEAAMATFGDAASIAVEEFVEGHEGFYDTITVGGHVVHDWATHYYPNVLDAMRHRWVSPQFVTTNRIDQAPFYAEVRELGARVIAGLGIETSATHMEWFMGPKGLRFSEIGARPPGVGAWDLYSTANDVDVYREWAHVIVNGHPDQPLTRRWSAGIVALRPDEDGSVRGYTGIDDLWARDGEWVIDTSFPDPGSPTQPVEAGYMANAWVRMRHPDYDSLRDLLDGVGRTVRVHAG